MSTAAPERMPQDSAADNDKPPSGSPPPAEESDKQTDAETTPVEDEIDPYELSRVHRGNRVKNNSGNAITNFGTMHVGASNEIPQVDGPVPDYQLRDSREVFVKPPQMAKAWSLLEQRSLVLLCGRGTGRTLTGINLLDEAGVAELLYLNAERSVETIAPRELSRGAGYVWNGSQHAHERRITTGRLGWLSREHGEAGTKLVLIVDDLTALPRDVHEFAVELTPPDPVDIVRKHLSRHGVDFDGLPQHVGEEAKRALVRGLAPEKAVDIADLLLTMRNREFRAEGGLLSFENRIERDALAWFQDEAHTLAARALMIAVAVFENRSSTEVFDAALTLEGLLDNPEHMDDWPLRPPDLFADTREARLAAIDAEEVHDPAQPSSRDRLIIRFRQPGRAAGVLRCVWQQYDRIRPTLKEWLETRPAYNDGHLVGARVFGTLLGSTRGPDPTIELSSWVARDTARGRGMAAEALGAMARQPDLVRQVRTRLRAWSRPEQHSTYRMTAALAYGGSFGQRFPNLAMERLRHMPRAAEHKLNDMVILGIAGLAEEPANRAQVFTKLLEWVREDNGVLRRVARLSALLVLGLMDVPAAHTNRHRRNIARDDEARRFVGPVVDDLMTEQSMSRHVIEGLDDWANQAETQPGLATGLQVVLREAFTATTPATRRRISHDIRRFVFEQKEAAAALRAAVHTTLRSINDQTG